MDALDIRILRAMGPLPYASVSGSDALRPARLARLVGVSPETVRDRIARMESSGVIAGYELVPNLRHLGLTATAFLLRSPDEASRERMRDALGLVEGVLEVTYFLGPETCVDLSFQTPGQRDHRVRILADAAGDPAPVAFLGWTMPEPERDLTPLDWRIVRALRDDAKRSLVDVAREMGLSYRTVKRRLDRMLDEGSVFVKPLIDPGAERGLVPFTLLVHLDEPHAPTTMKEVLRALDDHTILAQPPHSGESGSLDLIVFADSPRHVEELRRRAEAIPGVARVQALVLTEVEPRITWLDDLIASKVGSGAPTE